VRERVSERETEKEIHGDRKREGEIEKKRR
jgi:hypothetical protein